MDHKIYIHNVLCKNFRCFSSQLVTFNEHVTIIDGKNGVGKTSLLEALYYACYLRSFRTRIPKELISFEQKAFFVELELFAYEEKYLLQYGLSEEKRHTRLNGTVITSYQEIFNIYKVVLITNDDLILINGGPQERRLFLDQSLLLYDQSYINILKRYKKILEQRNALFQKNFKDIDTYIILSELLQKDSNTIKEHRKKYINLLLETMKGLLESSPILENLAITIAYKEHSDTSIFQYNKSFMERELLLKRSLFGAHLDDLIISLYDKKSRTYASRGQQKIIVALLKIAHAIVLKKELSIAPLLLIDDFISDLDMYYQKSIINLLCDMSCQLIITVPHIKQIDSDIRSLGTVVSI